MDTHDYLVKQVQNKYRKSQRIWLIVAGIVTLLNFIDASWVAFWGTIFLLVISLMAEYIIATAPNLTAEELRKWLIK